MPLSSGVHRAVSAAELSASPSCHAVCVNTVEDVVKYTVRALGCGYVINKQLHIRPRLNQVSQY